jgi:hypothetical protein
MVLSARNLAILTRDRTSLILMLLVPPLVGGLDLILGPVMGRDIFSYTEGHAANAGVTLFLMTIYALLVGAMSQMREFVKEADIYKRERLVNLRIFPYVTSKVWVAVLLALYQALCYTGLHYLAFRMPGGAIDFGAVYVTMVFAVLTGMMLGLLASALAPSASSVPMIIIALIIPLIVLSGVLAPVPPAISQIASTRWAWQGLMGISGIGSDVAADACWELDAELREAMTLEDKQANNCRCMGRQMFSAESCNYPGLGKLQVAELSQDPPARPTDLPPEPPSPTFPDPPPPPADQTDQVQVSQYLNALVAYQEQSQAIGDEAQNQGDLYRAMAAIYQGQMAQYQEQLLTYSGRLFGAVAAGEGEIAVTKKLYGWAWVNKDAPGAFYPWLVGTWVAQLLICSVYFVLILFFIKRKDVK